MRAGAHFGVRRRRDDDWFDTILDVASGEQSKSEKAGVGEEEFNPWIMGAML